MPRTSLIVDIAEAEPARSSSRNSTHSLFSIFASLGQPLEPMDLLTYQNETIDASTIEPTKRENGSSISTKREIEKRLDIRNWCIGALVLSLTVALFTLVVGIYFVRGGRPPLPAFLHNRMMSVDFFLLFPWGDRPGLLYISGHRVFSVPRAWTTIIPLVLNIALTAMLDAQNIIHTTRLRGELLKEERLRYNSSSSLFMSLRSSDPNHWSVNIVTALSSSTAYGALALIPTKIYLSDIVDDDGNILSQDVPGPRYGIDFGGWPLSFLGFSLLVQTSISIWALLKSRGVIESWSADPVVNARIALQCWKKENLNHVLNSSNTSAGSLQKSARESVPCVKKVATCIWILVGLSIVWTIVVATIAARTGTTNLTAVNQISHQINIASVWQSFGVVSFLYYDDSTGRRDWLGVIIQSAVQGILTMCLHCADLLVQFSNDERSWRRACDGFCQDPEATFMEGKEALASWATAAMFVFKSVAQWIFGFALSVNLFAVMSLLPLIALCVVLVLIVIYVELLVRWPSKEGIPATYGDIRQVAFWIEKFEDTRRRESGDGMSERRGIDSV